MFENVVGGFLREKEARRFTYDLIFQLTLDI